MGSLCQVSNSLWTGLLRHTDMDSIKAFEIKAPILNSLSVLFQFQLLREQLQRVLAKSLDTGILERVELLRGIARELEGFFLSHLDLLLLRKQSSLLPCVARSCVWVSFRENVELIIVLVD